MKHYVVVSVDKAPRAVLATSGNGRCCCCPVGYQWWLSSCPADCPSLCLSFKDFLLSFAKKGEWEFLASGLTDTPPLTQVKDIVREKLFLHLNKEIPYVLDQVRLKHSSLLVLCSMYTPSTGNMLCNM